MKTHFNLYILGNIAWRFVRAVLLIGISFTIIYPLLVKFSLAFMEKSDVYDITVKFVPKHFTLENLIFVFKTMKYPLALFNTFKVSLLTTFLQLASCTLVGYGFARFKFKGRELLFSLVIFTLLMPPQTIMVPIYMQFRYYGFFGLVKFLTGNPGINLLNTTWPYILTAATCMGIRNGLYIYIIRQFFRGIPKECEEAALVDGAGIFRTFYTIMLPSTAPVIITVILFSFVWQWNDLFYSNLFQSESVCLPVMLDTLIANVMNIILKSSAVQSINPGYAILLKSTGALLVIAPLVILYVFVQKYFVESIEHSGLVG